MNLKSLIPVFVIPPLLWAAGWVWVLVDSHTPNNFLSQILPWPVACTARGCVTTRAWQQQMAVSERFAAATQTSAQNREEALTSAVRRHIAENAFLQQPVRIADARRYREEILHLKDETLATESVGLSLAQYDKLVVLPFLQQAALQQARKAETLDELYATLSREHYVLILSRDLMWDKENGKVIRRD